jgi:hypothetical protein
MAEVAGAAASQATGWPGRCVAQSKINPTRRTSPIVRRVRPWAEASGRMAPARPSGVEQIGCDRGAVGLLSARHRGRCGSCGSRDPRPTIAGAAAASLSELLDEEGRRWPSRHPAQGGAAVWRPSAEAGRIVAEETFQARHSDHPCLALSLAPGVVLALSVDASAPSARCLALFRRPRDRTTRSRPRRGRGRVVGEGPGGWADPGVGHKAGVAAVPVARKPVSHPILRTCRSWQ